MLGDAEPEIFVHYRLLVGYDNSSQYISIVIYIDRHIDVLGTLYIYIYMSLYGLGPSTRF